MFDLFRSFLPLHNPAGFGVADFIELAIVVLLVGLAALWNRGVQALVLRLAENTRWAMVALAMLPIALRLLLLVHYPVPIPSVSDEFSYVLSGDTLRHFRLANPPLAQPQFFEELFVLQEPTHSSIYPLGQGIVLAIGWIVFGTPWAGVVISIGALAALCYWMLRGWTTPGWAFLGGALAAMEFGPLSQWMNSYWGGAVSACAGCLVFGSLPRLRRTGETRYAVLLGAGLAIQILTRPYEFVFVAISVLLFLPWRVLMKKSPVIAAVFLPAIVLMLFQNRAVTGRWLTMPYVLSRYQYGVPSTFTFQQNPVAHRAMIPQQQLTYDLSLRLHGPGTNGLRDYIDRLASRVRYYRFFFLAPLYLVLPLFLLRLREYRFAWVAVTLLLFALGTDVYPYFFTHYVAALTCLFVLISVIGLEQLSRIQVRGRATGHQAALLIVFLCVAHFVFWYALNLFQGSPVANAAIAYEPWDAINPPDPDGRRTTMHQLLSQPGKQIVFVHYSPRQAELEWVQNAADMDGARIIWAHDLGEDDAKLMRQYSDRTPWLFDTDTRRLTRLQRNQP